MPDDAVAEQLADAEAKVRAALEEILQRKEGLKRKVSQNKMSTGPTPKADKSEAPGKSIPRNQAQ
eukprot:7625554-Lingulodinium_polyedra.AAC.1